jgi:hypothetical protein
LPKYLHYDEDFFMRVSHSVSSSLIAGAFAVTLGGPAAATENADFNFDTTEDLYAVCSTAPDAPEYVPALLACRAFIEAAVQYHDEVSDRKEMKRLICYPSTATIENGRTAFVAWAKAHAGDTSLMNEVPVIGLVRALAAQYPCK